MKTKEKILVAAKDYLLKYGQAGFTVRSVAGEAGVNQGLIHHYFGSKQNLIIELIKEVTTKPFEEAKRLVVDIPKSEVKSIILKILVTNNELVKLLIEFINLAQHSPEIKEILKKTLLERKEFMTKVLGITEPNKKTLFMAGIFGMILVKQVDDSVNVEATIKELFNSFGIF